MTRCGIDNRVCEVQIMFKTVIRSLKRYRLVYGDDGRLAEGGDSKERFFLSFHSFYFLVNLVENDNGGDYLFGCARLDYPFVLWRLRSFCETFYPARAIDANQFCQTRRGDFWCQVLG